MGADADRAAHPLPQAVQAPIAQAAFKALGGTGPAGNRHRLSNSNRQPRTNWHPGGPRPLASPASGPGFGPAARLPAPLQPYPPAGARRPGENSWGRNRDPPAGRLPGFGGPARARPWPATTGPHTGTGHPRFGSLAMAASMSASAWDKRVGSKGWPGSPGRRPRGACTRISSWTTGRFRT